MVGDVTVGKAPVCDASEPIEKFSVSVDTIAYKFGNFGLTVLLLILIYKTFIFISPLIKSLFIY